MAFKKKIKLFLMGLGLIVVMALCFYLYIAYFLPLPNGLANRSNIPATKIYDRHGTLLYEVLRPQTGKVTLIPLRDMPEKFIQATLAAEDVNFYSHPGVDFLAIIRAILLNISEGRIVSGGSTITQQLIRNMLGTESVGSGDDKIAANPADDQNNSSSEALATFEAKTPSKQRGLVEKIMEAFYAIRLSHIYSKDRILELYLNTIYYGNMSYGAQSAALDYFGRNLSDLDLAQIALLAGLPQSPSTYNPYLNFKKTKLRQKYVLDQMVKNNFITRGEAEAAYAEPITLRGNKFQMKAPHFVHQVMNEIEAKYGEKALYYGGLSIITTLDYDMQKKAEQLVKKQVEKLSRNNVTNGALVALDPKTGQVLAWVGSADYFNDEIAGSVDIVTSLRQPGSSIKPLTYLLAFEKGWTPATVIFDIPTQFQTESGPYSPKNYDLKFHGPVRARIALASSFNIPAVKTLEYVGVDNFIMFLKQLGIGTLDKPAGFYGLALTLGGGEVRLIDMADAYAVIANYGVRKAHSLILQVKQGEKQLYDWTPPLEEYVLGPNGKQHAYEIIDILKDPNARIPGFGEGSVLELTRPAAVKTGTTRNFRDNWTIGFTPELLTAVWVGNADASPMQNVSGVDGAAPIWAGFMESALTGKPKTDFAVPSGMKEVEICSLSGKLATPICPERAYEIFAEGEEPTQPDDYYKIFNLDIKTGRAIHDECLSDYGANIKPKTMVDYPPELQKWAQGEGLALPQFEPCSRSQTGTGAYPQGYPHAYPDDKSDTISIDSPAKNDEYLLDRSIPLKYQKIPFRVTVPNQTVSVSYYLDNPEIISGSPRNFSARSPAYVVEKAPFTYLWVPIKGQHTLTAIAKLENGKTISDSVNFTIK